jgi:hypothetical protein
MSNVGILSLADRVSARAFDHLRAVRHEAERALPGVLSQVVLFGSRARADGKRGSDYDVAVFIRGPLDRRAATRRLTDVAYPHLLAGFHIRPIAVPADYLSVHGREPLAASIARDGVTIP